MIALSLIQDEMYNGILMIGWKSGDTGIRTWIGGGRSRGITSSTSRTWLYLLQLPQCRDRDTISFNTDITDATTIGLEHPSPDVFLIVNIFN